jgi:cytochrome P450
VALAHAGNRDPRAFRDPDEFDIDRRARNHLSFGSGPHMCLGQHLARTELHVVLDTIVRRLPDIRLAVPAEELVFKDDALVYGVRELPVTW